MNRKGIFSRLRLTPVLSTAGVLALMIFAACKEKELKPVDIKVNDPYRHYYPVIQGETLPVVYEIENTSKDPLVIQEIQTSCGCIVPSDDLPIMVLPGKKGRVRLAYNSNKNTGFVEHQVYLYGNFTDSVYRLLTFDTHVVPPADYTRDYEERWKNQEERGGDAITLEELVDGKSTQKGYYTDESGDKRENNREEMQREVDKVIGF